jgi:PAS domain S-box-containing protein
MSIKIVNYFKKTGKSDHIQNENYESENKNFVTMNLSRELYKQLFNQIPDGVCIFSFQHDFSKGKIIDANNSLCSILGVEKYVILNLNPDIFFTASTSNKQEIFNTLIKSNEVLFECTLTHANASPVHAEISSRIVEKTESVVILSIIRDISGKKAKNIEVNKQEDTLRQITENTSPGDKSFFNSLIIQFSNYLKADYAFIGETITYNNKIRTISFCRHDEIIPNIEYDLANTPCYFP